MMLCGIGLPSDPAVCERDEGSVECLRANGHSGRHLGRLPDGSYIWWTFETDCGCETDCDCFDYEIVPKTEIASFLGN